jgi:FtsP/CotA-like multicopper oxidase with cupredoxin domain
MEEGTTMKRRFIAIAAVAAGAVIAGGMAPQLGWLWAAGLHAPRTEVKATLLAPPLVPPPIARRGPALVLVDLETTEEKGTLASGVEYTFWTFGGTVPGPFVRVRTGDTVRIRLSNARSSLNTHSIDLRQRPRKIDRAGRETRHYARQWH